MIDITSRIDDGPLRNLLRTFTYKPTWSFFIEREALIIRAEVIDTDNHKKIIPLSLGVSIPQFVHPSFNWTRWLFDQIMEVERHEVQEFFKIDGVKVYDPHG